MRTILLLLYLSACGVDVSSVAQESNIGGYCGMPPEQCFPNTDYAGGNVRCFWACLTMEGRTGYCPEYSWYELEFCRQQYWLEGVCQFGQPIYNHFCLLGQTP